MARVQQEGGTAVKTAVRVILVGLGVFGACGGTVDAYRLRKATSQQEAEQALVGVALGTALAGIGVYALATW
jgi:imidazoleglycerol phosphate synthase glutamine amidotransferase subunit HisH